MNEHPLTCSDVDALLEQYADSDLEAGTIRRIREHLAHCNTCARQLDAVTAIDESLSVLPLRSPAPARKTAILHAACGAGLIRGLLEDLRAYIFVRQSTERTILEFAVVTALVVIIALQPWRATPVDVYTDEEIALAKQQTEMILAYVGRKLTHVSEQVNNKVLPDYVIKPLFRPLQSLSELDHKGDPQ